VADSLARKVALIAQACSYVQKTGVNKFHNYRYATAADVLAKVNEAMVEHGVCATVDAEILNETNDAGNRTVTVKTVLTLHDADSEQTFTTAGIGCGQDKGDKAVMKAQTAALKYSWMMALNISTGDDPEADDETDKRAHAPRQPAAKAPARDADDDLPEYVPPPARPAPRPVAGGAPGNTAEAAIKAQSPLENALAAWRIKADELHATMIRYDQLKHAPKAPPVFTEDQLKSYVAQWEAKLAAVTRPGAGRPGKDSPL
jgi:hypothetical protein